MVASIRFTSLLLTSLLVGTMFGIWLGFDLKALSAAAYVEMQQNAIRALNLTLPLMGLACIVLNAALAVLTKDDKRHRLALVAAVVLLVIAGLITRFANQPINALVVTWSPQSPPPGWQDLRATWWHWHTWRTLAGMAALSLVLLVAVSAAKRAASPPAA